MKVSGTIPPPLSHHTVEIIGDNLYLFGGNDAKGFSNTLYVLNTSKCSSSPSCRFRYVMTTNLQICKETWAWTTPATLGTVPAPRSGHSACALAKSILIYGGAGASKSGREGRGGREEVEGRWTRGKRGRGEPGEEINISIDGLFSDTYSLDVETLTWQLVPNVDGMNVRNQKEE